MIKEQKKYYRFWSVCPDTNSGLFGTETHPTWAQSRQWLNRNHAYRLCDRCCLLPSLRSFVDSPSSFIQSSRLLRLAMCTDSDCALLPGAWAGISSPAASHTGLTGLPCWCHSRGGLSRADPRLTEWHVQKHSTLHKLAPASAASYLKKPKPFH